MKYTLHVNLVKYLDMGTRSLPENKHVKLGVTSFTPAFHPRLFLSSPNLNYIICVGAIILYLDMILIVIPSTNKAVVSICATCIHGLHPLAILSVMEPSLSRCSECTISIATLHLRRRYVDLSL